MRPYHIWMEGYVATGESGKAQRITEDPIIAPSFDDAVKIYADTHPDTKVDPYTRNSFMTEEAYENRDSNWKIWGCALYPDEATARKAFG